MRLGLVVVLLLIAGCKKSDQPGGESAAVKVNGDTIEIRTEDGTVRMNADGGAGRIESKDGTVTFGENQVPEGFPLPLRPGAKVEHGAHMTGADGAEVFQLTCDAPGTAKELADFYEKEFKDRGLEVMRTEQGGGGTVMFILAAQSEDVDASAMIVQEGGTNRPRVTLSWSSHRK
jgi:hypothetical protein